MRFIKGLITAFLDALFPNKCIGCDVIIPKGESVCDFCLENLLKTNFDTRCKVCGNLKKDCLCKYHVFHFTSATAPFYNDGTAQKIMYAFKFNRKLHFAKFFAERMAISVKTDFYGTDFDCIVYVPMALKKELKRGYNQSRELAKEISKQSVKTGCNTDILLEVNIGDEESKWGFKPNELTANIVEISKLPNVIIKLTIRKAYKFEINIKIIAIPTTVTTIIFIISFLVNLILCL